MKHPETESEARRLLEELECEQPAGAQLSTRLLPALIAAVTLIVISAVIVFAKELHHAGVTIEIGSIVVAATLAFGIFQWRAALEKDALEKYQAEIKEANEKRLQWQSIPELMKEHYPTDREHCFYVYQQLDNLEFAIERYLRGFTSAYTASRAVLTFKSKCEAAGFRDLAKMLVQRGSYSPSVKRIVARCT